MEDITIIDKLTGSLMEAAYLHAEKQKAEIVWLKKEAAAWQDKAETWLGYSGELETEVVKLRRGLIDVKDLLQWHAHSCPETTSMSPERAIEHTLLLIEDALQRKKY